MIIYYSDVFSDHGCHFDHVDPDPLMKHIVNGFTDRDRESSDWPILIKCPSFKDSISNTFCVRALHDVHYERTEFNTTYFPDEEKFMKGFYERSADGKMMSFTHFPIVFASEEPVVMEQLPPYLETTEFAKKTRVIPGRFDISKHIRPIEVAFDITGDASLKLNDQEVMYYVRFDTEEEIEFKKFMMTPEIHQMITSNYFPKRKSKSPLTLPQWYERNRKSKKVKMIMKMIKQNVI